MDNNKDKEVLGNVEWMASSGAEEWKDVLQLLKKQIEKMERLARFLSVIQQGMLRNNPGFVKGSVNDSALCVSGRYPKKLTKGEKIESTVKSAFT